MREQLERVIEDFRPGFHADGMDLAVGTIDPAGVVQVKVLLGPEACLECLIPEDLMADMFRAAMGDVMPSLTRVDIVRESVDAVPRSY